LRRVGGKQALAYGPYAEVDQTLHRLRLGAEAVLEAERAHPGLLLGGEAQRLAHRVRCLAATHVARHAAALTASAYAGGIADIGGGAKPPAGARPGRLDRVRYRLYKKYARPMPTPASRLSSTRPSALRPDRKGKVQCSPPVGQCNGNP
jgi:hypothetical protein